MPNILSNRRRPAGQNEHRCIVRQDLGYYRALPIAAVYTTHSESQLGLQDKRVFLPALKHCIARHPILSTVVLGSDTESPEFATPSSLNLENHIRFLEAGDARDETSIIKDAIAQAADEIYGAVDDVPPWKIVVTKLPSSGRTRLLITFAFYHSHGDGKSGLAFHKTFLEGLNANEPARDASFQCEPPTTPLPPPLERAGNLSISWSYLLAPLLGAYLPTFVGSALGFQASTASQDHNVWRGDKASFPTDAHDFRTGIELVTLEEPHMKAVLNQCRAVSGTFTGLLHQLIVRALSEVRPDVEAFSGDTAIDLRQHTNGALGNDDMALCVTVDNEVFQRSDASQWRDWTTDRSALVWQAARKTSEGLRQRASTMHDQPIGLLKYLNDFRSWTSGKIGKDREASYEISNLVSFCPQAPSSEDRAIIEQVIFAQPANAVGPALQFNAVSTKGGSFVLTITWQRGVLGVGRDELTTVAEIGGHLKTYLVELANAAL